MELGTVNVRVNGPVLRELRKLAGLSVTELAANVGCSIAYITILETNPDRSCSPGVFARICDALHLADRTVLLREPEGTEPEQAEVSP